MAFCIHCGAPLPEVAKFCSHCGASVVKHTEPSPSLQPPSQPSDRKCQNCGEIVPKDFSFCTKCGAPAARTGAPPPAQPQAAAQPEKKCPYCAESVKAEAVKCRHCGQWLSGPGVNQPLPGTGAASTYPASGAQFYSLGSIGAYVALFIIGGLLLVVGFVSLAEHEDGAIPAFIFGGILILIAEIFLLVLTYQIWRFVIAESWRYKLTPSISSPGKAVGYLFIPIFNLYWMFVVYGKFPRDCNALARAKGKTGTLSEGVGYSIPILNIIGSFLGVVPILSGFLILIIFILQIVFYSSALRQCKELRDMR